MVIIFSFPNKLVSGLGCYLVITVLLTCIITLSGSDGDHRVTDVLRPPSLSNLTSRGKGHPHCRPVHLDLKWSGECSVAELMTDILVYFVYLFSIGPGGLSLLQHYIHSVIDFRNQDLQHGIYNLLDFRGQR